MPRTLSITPYAASLLSRELTLPAVVPSRTAMSLVVSPFGQLCKISMIRLGKSLLAGPKLKIGGSMPTPCSLELRERVVEGHRVRRIATRGRGMVRGASEFGHQMDAAAAGNRKWTASWRGIRSNRGAFPQSCVELYGPKRK